MNSRAEILEKLGGALDRASNGRAKLSELTEKSQIIEDVGLSSLDLLELRCELEERWQTNIADEELMRLRTVGDVIDLVEERSSQ